MTIWETLQIDPTKDKKQIEQAYAQQLAQYQPEAFQAVQKAYQKALFYAAHTQTEAHLLNENQQKNSLISSENKTDYPSFEALNAYLEYVIHLCKTSDSFAIAQLINDQQFEEVKLNTYFMNQLTVHIELNYQVIKTENIEALQQIYGTSIRPKDGTILSRSQALLISSLLLQKAFHSKSKTDFYQYYNKLTRNKSWDQLAYLKDLAKNKKFYSLSNTFIFQTLDYYKVDYVTGYAPLLKLVNEEAFSSYNENNILLSWFSSALFTISRSGFMLKKQEVEDLTRKFQLNETSDSALTEQAKSALAIAIQKSQKKTIRKKLAYRKLKKADQAHL